MNRKEYLEKHTQERLDRIDFLKNETDRLCKTCSIVKPVADFNNNYTNNKGTINISHSCKQCISISNKQKHDKKITRRQQKYLDKFNNTTHLTCTLCNVEKDVSQFRVEKTPTGNKAYRKQCNDCRNQQTRERNKNTDFYKKQYAAMTDEQRKEYIAKKSAQNKWKRENDPKFKKMVRKYDQSDIGRYKAYSNECNRRNRLKRGITMELSFEEFSEIINKNCTYCGVENARGVDRLDTNKSYTIENAQPCCKICNQMKNSLSEDDFLQHIHDIIDNWYFNINS